MIFTTKNDLFESKINNYEMIQILKISDNIRDIPSKFESFRNLNFLLEVSSVDRVVAFNLSLSPNDIGTDNFKVYKTLTLNDDSKRFIKDIISLCIDIEKISQEYFQENLKKYNNNDSYVWNNCLNQQDVVDKFPFLIKKHFTIPEDLKFIKPNLILIKINFDFLKKMNERMDLQDKIIDFKDFDKLMEDV